MQPHHSEEASHALVAALAGFGLHACDFTRGGLRYVHVSPLKSPTAGTNVLCTPSAEGACDYVSEWGSRIGDTRHLSQAATYLCWLFGCSARR